MTKEELEREARINLKRRFGEFFPQLTISYVMGAEPREKQIADLEAQMEKMKKYIKACWVEENLNDYSSYITNTSDEFRDLVKELNDEVRNGR